ncbi:uncharacterized protein LOC111920331 isoform X1 [Lactuca sativa]|uniref:Adenylosuccinate synthase n=1 Tax=Lactuca sativa TaxID=4236 RepID=A0A9R1W2I7_LACSA|nr:uncharacterized protein LOC111920331 isoform X1 [Lactuca sativa]KAJ0215352.1 hypothetical protein LSAT_V11C300125170 [Lactuca sativa]
MGCKGRILISDRAHLLFDYHQEIDGLREYELSKSFVGTSKRGIGPCYSSKVIRNGIRVCDVKHMDTFPDKLDLSFQWFVIYLISCLWIILPGSGYMSPKYIINGHFSTKFDVYNFGLLPLEIINGKNWGFQHPDHNLSLLSHLYELQHVLNSHCLLQRLEGYLCLFHRNGYSLAQCLLKTSYL